MNELMKIEEVKITKEDVKRLWCASATDKEIEIFIEICKLYQLNPFKREIYLIKYGTNPAMVVTGYETYLKRAERTGKYCGFEIATHGSVKEGNLTAKIVLHRKDWEKPLVHEVDYEEYKQIKNDGTLNVFWKNKPKTMLKKVCISQAFRFAFPDELGGMPYTQDEMPLKDVDVEIKPSNIATQKEIEIKKGLENITDIIPNAEAEKLLPPEEPQITSQTPVNPVIIMPTAEADERGKLYSALGIARKDNNISEQLYRNILQENFGQITATKLTMLQLKELLQILNK